MGAGGAAGELARGIGVPHALQNLSVGLATVPHCGHALMVSPSGAFRAPDHGAARNGEHIEVAPEIASYSAAATMTRRSELAARTCPSCGATVDAEPAGGRVGCRYCGYRGYCGRVFGVPPHSPGRIVARRSASHAPPE